MVTTINSENKSAFEDVITLEAEGFLRGPDAYALGAIYETGEQRLAAGALIFSVEAGSSGEENMSAAILKWLYVAEEFRGKGIADELLAEMLRILGKAGVDDTLCDLPMPAEYDPLCGYMESLGFQFSLAELYEIRIQLGDMLALKAFQKRVGQENCVPLSRLHPSKFRQLIHQIGVTDSGRVSISADPNKYDQDVSCVCGDENGALLLRGDAETGFDLIYMGALRERARTMSAMMLFSAGRAAEKYPPETWIRISCKSHAAAVTMENIFPESEPLLVRRGHLSLYDFLEEATT